MDVENPEEILVGIDGSDGAGVVLQYALEQARRLKAPVRIVHVVPGTTTLPPEAADRVLRVAQALVLRSVQQVQRAGPEVEVRSALLVGPRREEFVHAARSAQMVVLGSSGHLGTLPTGSVAGALVEHTDCPVRIVPVGWDADARRTGVVVGIEDVATAHDLIRRGFEIAAETGQPLVLLHAWGVPSGYEDVLSATESEDWIATLADRLTVEARATGVEFPSVEVQVRFEHQRPAVALEEASRRAAFVLLGRSTHHHPVGRRTGPTHILMNVSSCPVEVGPEPHGVATPPGPPAHRYGTVGG